MDPNETLEPAKDEALIRLGIKLLKSSSADDAKFASMLLETAVDIKFAFVSNDKAKLSKSLDRLVKHACNILRITGRGHVVDQYNLNNACALHLKETEEDNE